ncbi:MAG: hypothetical protein P4N41_21985 [Negativicutes bacterium]|nr:hypothetical protein [Negativicutes bacterium]
MTSPRRPWLLSEFFDPDIPEADDYSPESADSAIDGLIDEDSSFWDHMIFPL